MTTRVYWQEQQVRAFVKDVRRECGDGWAWLTPRVREALIADRAFAACRGQASESVDVAAMDELIHRMRVEAGLETES